MSEEPNNRRNSESLTVRSRSDVPIEIIIGIDYGTRFTKVGVGREGQEPTVWAGLRGSALIPSIVHIATDGRVFPWPDATPDDAVKIEYLKMLLAKPDDSIFELPSTILVEQERDTIIRALAAFFLSEIVLRVQKSEREKSHLRNANIRWLVNVGVPVEYYDAPERDAFREVASVALNWAEAPPTHPTVASLARSYLEISATLDLDNSPASVFPELAAALTEYIRDPNRPEGQFYGFCDIGGGTIDGAIFRLRRDSSLPRLAILSASVAPYGTAAVARGLVERLNDKCDAGSVLEWLAQFETLLTARQVTPPSISQDPAALLFKKHEEEPKSHVQAFVRKFVNEARMKRNVNGYTFADAFTGEKIELRFFLAGGGAESGWYRACIGSLDPEENVAFYGVKKLRLETVKRTSFREADFPRFVIALGLTSSPDELEEASQRLPSKIKKKPPMPEREPVRAITKDDM